MKRFAILGCAVLLFAARRMFAQQRPREPAKGEGDERSYHLPPEKYRQAVEYSRAKYRLHFFQAAYSLAAAAAVMLLRVPPRLRDAAETASRRRWLQAGIYAPLLALTLDTLHLPLAVYGHKLAVRYGQSVQGWGSWTRDLLKSAALGAAMSSFMVWLLYGAIRRSPRLWWLYFWLASIPIIVFVLFISPLVIEPLFFRFKRLEEKHPELAEEIRRVAARGGLEIPSERIFEMEASAKMKSVNAYVSGFGASQRVVVWDTTLEKMTVPETLFVFGHEMGHYVLGHIPRTIAFASLLTLASLALGFRGVNAAVERVGPRLGVRGVDDWASLPILMVVSGLFGFFAEPVMSAYSRWQERQADVYGLDVIREIVREPGASAAKAFQTLGEINLADPNPHPFIRFWLYSHPPIEERIRFVRSREAGPAEPAG